MKEGREEESVIVDHTCFALVLPNQTCLGQAPVMRLDSSCGGSRSNSSAGTQLLEKT